MSYLLGSEYCIQSLSNDVNDVQSAIKDILNKTGRINSVSWKFPDKFACDLNIVDYLNTYKYDSDDNENNQVAHIVLLELTIDRLCLMLQLHCEFIERTIVKENTKSDSDKTTRNQNNKAISPCLGLTSKKHWNKMTQLSIFVDNLQKEMLLQKKSNRELLLEIEKLRKSPDKINNNHSLLSGENISQQASDWIKSLDNEQQTLKLAQKSVTGTISKDVGFKSSQTLDTAFKPCESCHISQTCFREMSSVLMQILKEESQPSSLLKLNQDLRSMDWLSDTKLMQIKDSFVKDFNKICSFYRDIRKREMKTSEELIVSRKLCDELREVVKQGKEQMEKEKLKFNSHKRELESTIEDQTNNFKVTQTKIHSMTDEFSNKFKQLQNEIANLNLQLLEKEKDSLQLAKVKMALADLQQHCDDPIRGLTLVRQKIDEQEQKITNLNITIENQKALNSNLSDIENTAMDKESKLMKRLQSLTDQKRKLEEKIDNLEINLENAVCTMKELENQRVTLSMEITEKNGIIDNLIKTKDECTEKILDYQHQISIMEETVLELEKDKQLLLHYPDLDGPLEKYDSGNVADDIHMQIKANSTRIKILSHQNADLGNALSKLKETSTSVPNTAEYRSTGEPINVHSGSDLKLIITRPVSNMSTTFHSTARQKPRHPTPTKATEPQNQVLQWSTTTQKSPTPMPCVCETCGRQYSQKSDLDIHKEYCAGRRRKVNQK